MRISSRVRMLTEPEGEAVAVRLLREYFTPWPMGRFTGSRFESLGGGGDRPEIADVFTSEDLVAVSCLAVEIPSSAALQILELQSRRLNDLLHEIPADLALVRVDPSDITTGWPAWDLYYELKAIDGLGVTKVSKLLARKRPHLIPIRDKYVASELSLADAFWLPLAGELREGNSALHKRLLTLRSAAGLPDSVSALRILDVLTWRAAKGHLHELPPVR